MSMALTLTGYETALLQLLAAGRASVLEMVDGAAGSAPRTPHERHARRKAAGRMRRTLRALEVCGLTRHHTKNKAEVWRITPAGWARLQESMIRRKAPR